MSEARRPVIRLIVIVTAIVGFLVARWTVQKFMAGAFVQWQSLGAPPERAVKILRVEPLFPGDRGDISVETIAGQIYHCCRGSNIHWESQESESPYREVCGTYSPQPPLEPPGQPIDCAETPEIEWNLNRTTYVVLDDGTVWRWHHAVDFSTSLLLNLGGPCGGAVLGGVVSVLILRLTWRKKR
jgi:hypothetical protein